MVAEFICVKPSPRVSHGLNESPSSSIKVSPAQPVPKDPGRHRRHSVSHLKQTKALSLLIQLVFLFTSSSRYLAHGEIMDKTKHRDGVHYGVLKSGLDSIS